MDFLGLTASNYPGQVHAQGPAAVRDDPLDVMIGAYWTAPWRERSRNAEEARRPSSAPTAPPGQQQKAGTGLLVKDIASSWKRLVAATTTDPNAAYVVVPLSTTACTRHGLARSLQPAGVHAPLRPGGRPDRLRQRAGRRQGQLDAHGRAGCAEGDRDPLGTARPTHGPDLSAAVQPLPHAALPDRRQQRQPGEVRRRADLLDRLRPGRVGAQDRQAGRGHREPADPRQRGLQGSRRPATTTPSRSPPR